MTAGWRLDITPPARRDLRRLDPPIRGRVRHALDRLIADPPAGDIIKLQGQDEHRLRVGDWRVLLRLAPDEQTVYCFAYSHAGARTTAQPYASRAHHASEHAVEVGTLTTSPTRPRTAL